MIVTDSPAWWLRAHPCGGEPLNQGSLDRTPFNNGMHPTANQRTFYRRFAALEAVCAAGEAGRCARRGEDTKLLKLSGS